MTMAVEQFLASFDRLSRSEQVCAVKEIQDRMMAAPVDESELDFTPLTDEELTQLTDELFQMSDAEEARRHGAA